MTLVESEFRNKSSYPRDKSVEQSPSSLKRDEI